MALTYILYNSSDDRSASLIATEKGFTKYTPIPPYSPPITVVPSELLSNNIVCVGLWTANPYVVYYFPNLRLDKLYNPTRFPDQPEIWKIAGEFGISADGKYIIYTIKRANGTTVTVIAGIHEADTWKAANVFVSPTISPLIPVGVSTAVVGTVAGYKVIKGRR